MGRYRPPQPESSPYITAEGAQKLEKELKQLWKIERPQVTRAVQEAAKNGDRSENGDYIYGKKRLREIDRRVRYLGKRLEQLQVVDRTPANQEKIYFGAWVRIKQAGGDAKTFRIAGSDEIDSARGYISVDSPMAKSLLGKMTGDEITVKTPHGNTNWLITRISYQSPPIKESTAP